MKTAAEQLDRMEALVRRMARERHGRRGCDYDEAKAIVAELPPPPAIDPDVAEAQRLQNASPYNLDAMHAVTNGHIHTLIVAALKRGRERAHGEYVVGETTRTGAAYCRRVTS